MADAPIVDVDTSNDRHRYACAMLCRLAVAEEQRRRRRRGCALEDSANAHAQWARDWLDTLRVRLELNADEQLMLDTAVRSAMEDRGEADVDIAKTAVIAMDFSFLHELRLPFIEDLRSTFDHWLVMLFTLSIGGQVRGSYDARVRALLWTLAVRDFGMAEERVLAMELQCAKALQDECAKAVQDEDESAKALQDSACDVSGGGEDTSVNAIDSRTSTPEEPGETCTTETSTTETTIEISTTETSATTQFGDRTDLARARSARHRTSRIVYTALAATAGGLAIGLTGGLAAPLVGAGMAAMLGAIGIGGTAAFLGSAAGVALIASVFGATGAGLSSYRMARRTRGVREFLFVARCTREVVSDAAVDARAKGLKRFLPRIFRKKKADVEVGREEDVTAEKDEGAITPSTSTVQDKSMPATSTSTTQEDELTTSTSTTQEHDELATSTSISHQENAMPATTNDLDDDDNKTVEVVTSTSTKNISAPPSATPVALPFLPPFVTITVSGWLVSEKDITEPWSCLNQVYDDVDGLASKLSTTEIVAETTEDTGSDVCERDILTRESPTNDMIVRCFLNGEHYSLRWETAALLDVGCALRDLFAWEAVGWAGMEVLKKTVIAGLMTAAAWPASLLKVASVVDNPWSIALDRSRKAGLVLADVLVSHRHGHRPVTLIGSSLGARLLFHALLSLAERGIELNGGIVQDVVLLGMPMAPSREELEKVRAVVGGRLVNGYCTSDGVLGFLFRGMGLELSKGGLETIGGLGPLGGHANNDESVENVDLTEVVGGHGGYGDPNKMRKCLEICGIRTLLLNDVDEIAETSSGQVEASA